MAYFPVFVDIKDKKCLVIGGGKVAARKIATLLSYGADVHVISPQIRSEIIDMISEYNGGPDAGRRDSGPVIRREMLSPDELEREIRDSMLVVAASSGRDTNHQAAMICHRLGIPVNVVDDQSECSFFFPAVVKKGEISIGINTGGSSPIVSARIRQETEENLPDYYADIAGQLGQLREGLKEKMPEEAVRRRFLKKVAAGAFVAERPLTPEEIADYICSCSQESS